mmetsp:Transcript_111531/g.209188  ORF Transcript_111531/g.209188 Transcript_111531/m.209188 type:complete len:219 (+) Transcript_111531:409-1065(+)
MPAAGTSAALGAALPAARRPPALAGRQRMLLSFEGCLPALAGRALTSLEGRLPALAGRPLPLGADVCCGRGSVGGLIVCTLASPSHRAGVGAGTGAVSACLAIGADVGTKVLAAGEQLRARCEGAPSKPAAFEGSHKRSRPEQLAGDTAEALANPAASSAPPGAASPLDAIALPDCRFKELLLDSVPFFLTGERALSVGGPGRTPDITYQHTYCIGSA